MERVTIERGVIVGKGFRHESNDDEVDAICITTNQDVLLAAVGIMDCKGLNTVKCTVYKGSNYEEDNVVYESGEREYTSVEKSDKPIILEFESPVTIEKNVKYTVEIVQWNEGDHISMFVEDGKSEIQSGSLNVCFSEADYSFSGSEVETGAIPTLYFVIRRQY